MNCTAPRCLASYEWIGNPDDRVLVKLANERGWKLLEGQGWRCPRHIPARTALELG